ncbi:MAG: sugar ABC transporter permease [Clostridia bacterium]|nr:sugar ABC transporter permease [Clostridia bacterium]MBQ8332328.1 sugar ABC transporter permease [Clostridia bacterium]
MKKRTDILFLLPSLAGFLTFFIVPFFYSFTYAFTENAFTKKFVAFDNFTALFQNDFFRLAMKNTGKFTLCAVPLTMVLSILTALLIVRYAAKLPFVKSAFFLPVILPSATIVMLWQAYVSDAVPPFSSLLLIYLWKYGGLNVMLILTALTGMSKDMLDAAKIDGAGLLRTTWHVTLPNIAPTLFFTFILSVVNSLKIFRESFLLYTNYPDESVYMLQNYLNNHFQKLNYQNISTAAIFFAVIVYTVVAVVFVAEKKWSEQIW